MVDIKKIVRNIYQIDYSNITLSDDTEIIILNNGVSEFTQNFKKTDIDNGIIVTPLGYKRGLLFSTDNGGQIINNPSWIPDIVTFSLNVFGLKKGAFYRVLVKAKNAGKSEIVTADRTLLVTNSNNELLIEKNITNNSFVDESALFRATSTEMDLFFTIGKISIANIIIDEVEILDDEEEYEEEADTRLEEGKLTLEAYGVFALMDSSVNRVSKGKYIILDRIKGRGIRLYFDILESCFYIERDPEQDLLGESFTGPSFIVDINTNKIENNGRFDFVDIKHVDMTPSPNTFKQGYIKFAFVKNGQNVAMENVSDRLSILIHKIS